MRKAVLYILFIFISSNISANFVVSNRLTEAQNCIAKLQLDKGRNLIDLEKKENPNNQAAIFIENYIDLYKIISSQSIEEYHQLLPNRDVRLKLLSKFKPENPYYLYCQADVHLQWAFAKSQHGDFLSAALDFRSAFLLLQKNATLFPNFIYNNKDLGILKTIIGTIPDGYKWIANIAGVTGNYDEGMGLLKTFIAQSLSNQTLLIENQNAKLLYCLLLVNFEKDKVNNWKLTEKYTNDYEDNLLSNCIRAFIASKCDMTDEGIKNLLSKPHSRDYTSFYFTDYLLGSMKLTRLDEDAAIYLKKFVSFCTNKSLYEEAYNKLAWTYILKGDTANYYLYSGLSIKFKQNDKQWTSIPSQGTMTKVPNVCLLKTRLLTDGGYYKKAEQELTLFNIKKYNSDMEKMEFYYRYAKIYSETNQYQKAIENYNLVIKSGSQIQIYLVPNAHLQLASIYEKVGQKNIALQHYKNVLEYKNYQYKYGIEQKAKAGISKLEK